MRNDVVVKTTKQQQNYPVALSETARYKDIVAKVASSFVKKINTECYYILVLILYDKCFKYRWNKEANIANQADKILTLNIVWRVLFVDISCEN